MAFSALLTHIIFGRLIHGKFSIINSFIAGVFSVMSAAFLTGIFLYLSDKNFINAIRILMLAHIPLALFEGIVTAFLISWLKKSAPEFLS